MGTVWGVGTKMTFRAGVVAVIRRGNGDVLAFERADVSGAWQLPQGGLDAGEDPYDTVWREVAEETGLGPDQLEILGEYPEWVVYELPADRRSAKTGLGQAQKWFVFRVVDDAVVPTPDQREFVAWKWVTPSWLAEHVVDFRRASYERVLGTL